MSLFSKKVSNLLTVIPAILLVTFANVFIASVMSGVVLIQLAASGYNRYFSLGTAILVAIGTYAYIAYYHKIREFIRDRGAEKNE